MTPAELLTDALDRARETALAAVADLTRDQLAHRPAPEANSIGWLVWHLARVQDDHVADVADRAQVWTSEGYVDRFGLPFAPEDIGYGHSSEDVARVVPDAGLLADYLTAVHEQSADYLRTVSATDLDQVIDDRWDPPVTLGVRLVSVVNDDLQHAGQAAYVRGLLGR